MATKTAPALVDLPQCCTAAEVSELLKIGLSTTYDLCASGELEAFRLRTNPTRTRGAIRIVASSVASYLDRSRVRQFPSAARKEA